MSHPAARRFVPRGVYTIFALLGLIVAVAPIPAPARSEVTITPTMTQGPANARVTIVEFSDYQ